MKIKILIAILAAAMMGFAVNAIAQDATTEGAVIIVPTPGFESADACIDETVPVKVKEMLMGLPTRSYVKEKAALAKEPIKLMSFTGKFAALVDNGESKRCISLWGTDYERETYVNPDGFITEFKAFIADWDYVGLPTSKYVMELLAILEKAMEPPAPCECKECVDWNDPYMRCLEGCDCPLLCTEFRVACYGLDKSEIDCLTPCPNGIVSCGLADLLPEGCIPPPVVIKCPICSINIP